MTAPAPVRCEGCARSAAEPPLTWSMQVTARGEQWLCERCTRENVRSIEARLDETWW